MSSRAHQRQSKTSVIGQQTFDDNGRGGERFPGQIPLIDEPSSSGGIQLDRWYERAFFTINDSTVEILLNNDTLSWSATSIENSQKDNNNVNSLNLHDVYAITPVYDRCNWVLDKNDPQADMNVSKTALRGFQLHSYERMDDNVLEEICVIFQNKSSDQIERWWRLLSKIVREYKPARNMLVICNTYAGSGFGRHIYNTKIKPMFERAKYNVNYFEVNDLYSADEVFDDCHGDFNSLFGVVIIGGDGSVIHIMNALLRYLAKENRTRLNAETTLPSVPFPICIVPSGTTNIICQSIHGNTDHCTPILHLLFNRRMKIDMSAVFDVNYNFVTANFNSGAGYPANALKYFTRYSSLRPRKIVQKSFVKAASNKNLRSIEMEIRYIPADEHNIITTHCYQGCPRCTASALDEMDDQVRSFDDAHARRLSRRTKKPLPWTEQDNSLAFSKNTATGQEKRWTTLDHPYLQVAVLTNASLWSFAPQGLSKYSHLADGLLDLVLIEHTTRKEFLRYVKRNGNSKDQYQFPFANLIKVKEIEIELKSPNGSLTRGVVNGDDQLNLSESDESLDLEQQNHEPWLSCASMPTNNRPSLRSRHYTAEKTEEHSNSVDASLYYLKTKPPQVKSCSSNSPFRKRNILQSLKLKKEKTPALRTSSAGGNESTHNKQVLKNQQSTGGLLRSAKPFLNLLTGVNSSPNEKQDPSSTITKDNNRRSSSLKNRSSSLESRNALTLATKNQYRNKKQPCMWNLDFTPYNSPLIRIKCFYRFLPVFGVGQSPDTELKEVNYSCFGRIG